MPGRTRIIDLRSVPIMNYSMDTHDQTIHYQLSDKGASGQRWLAPRRRHR